MRKKGCTTFSNLVCPKMAKGQYSPQKVCPGRQWPNYKMSRNYFKCKITKCDDNELPHRSNKNGTRMIKE